MINSNLTAHGLRMLLSQGGKPGGPFLPSAKLDHIWVRFDRIRIGQYSNGFAVEYIWGDDAMVVAFLPQQLGLQAQVNLQNLDGKIEAFLGNYSAPGEVSIGPAAGKINGGVGA